MLGVLLTMGVFYLHQDGCLQGFPSTAAGWRFGCPPSIAACLGEGKYLRNHLRRGIPWSSRGELEPTGVCPV